MAQWDEEVDLICVGSGIGGCADEASFGEVAAKLREFDVWTHRPVNVPCYLIFDAQYWDKYGLQPLAPGSQRACHHFS